MAEPTQGSGSLETAQDAGQGEAGLVRLWLQAIELQDKQEEEWRKAAMDVVERYRLEKKHSSAKRGKHYPILYANTETLLPAIYNSSPLPDVRRRYGDGDDGSPARKAAQVLERALSHCADEYDLHSAIKDAVQDAWLPGRGVTRIRYEAVLAKDQKSVIYHKTWAEHVAWPDFRMGPARRWPNVPWIAYRHLLTREQMTKLNAKIGGSVPLDHTIDGAKAQDGQRDVPDVFKRGLVWEVWNKEAREVLFIAPAYPDGPLRQEPDKLGLEQFFDIPRPLQAIQTTDTMVPIEPFRIYKDQADELDLVTKRINALMKACKARGIYDAALAGAMEKMKHLEDGEYAPATGDEANKFTMSPAGIEKAVWSWPIEVISDVLTKLYENREQIKAVIFELTGIADIMRGSTKAQETKGAQELKTQWGTLRIQPAQQDVQRYARDIMRLKSEIIGEKYDPQTLTMITGIDCVSPQMDQQTGQPVVGPDGQPVPNPIPPLLKSDKLRSYRIDIETDSTIRGDVARSQEQIARFVEGSGAFFTSMGPAVEAGVMDAATGLTLYTSFARTFKLGKDAEDALEGLIKKTQEQAKQPPAPDPEQAKVAAEQQKMQMEAQLKQAEMQASMQSKAQELELKKAEMQAKLEFEQQKMAMEQQRHEQQMAMDAQKAEADMQMRGAELQLKEREGQMKAQLDAAKIADGRDARQEEREMIDAGQMQVPKGQRAMAFMDETREGLKTVAERGDQLGEIVQQVMQMIAQMKADNDDTFEAERVRGADGKLAGLRKRYASGRTVEIPIR